MFFSFPLLVFPPWGWILWIIFQKYFAKRYPSRQWAEAPWYRWMTALDASLWFLCFWGSFLSLVLLWYTMVTYLESYIF